MEITHYVDIIFFWFFSRMFSKKYTYELKII